MRAIAISGLVLGLGISALPHKTGPAAARSGAALAFLPHGTRAGGASITRRLQPLVVSERPVWLRSARFELSTLAARSTRWHYAVASAYSAASTGSTRQGCPGAPPLTDSARSVATFLVPCGRRLVVCYRSRCVVARRTDSGPFVAGRQIDLNVGAARALGATSALGWGVRVVRWRRR